VKQRYTIDDHLHLEYGSPTRSLFESIRKDILALDPCVSEEFLKHHVAYRAEKSFVDIVPQKNLLRLFLNLPFHELSEPRGLAENVTGLGHWGNDDVRLGFSKSEDLPYPMGLIRQAFEKQMENGEVEM